MTTHRKQAGVLNCVVCGKRLHWQLNKAGVHPECKGQAAGRHVVANLLGPKPVLEVKSPSGPLVDPSTLTHDPGSCAICGERVRNDDRMYHLRCEDALIEKHMPNRARPLPPADAPRARICTVCRSRDNSMSPSEECQRCGNATVPAPIQGAKHLPKPQRLEVEKYRASDDDGDDDDDLASP